MLSSTWYSLPNLEEFASIQTMLTFSFKIATRCFVMRCRNARWRWRSYVCAQAYLARIRAPTCGSTLAAWKRQWLGCLA